MSREEGGWLLGHAGVDDRGRRARSHAGGEARCGCQVGTPWQLRCVRVVRCAAVGLAPFCWAARGKGEVGAGLRASVLGRGREGKGAGWVEAGFGLVSGFLFSGFSYFLSFQTSLKLIEFKLQFEFKPYALNQIKQCSSMNATTG